MIAIRLLGFLWSLPVTLVGLVVVCVSGPTSASWRWWGWHGVRGILEFRTRRIIGGYQGQTFGHVQLYVEGAEPQRLRKHEDTHTLQGDLFGALNLPIYGACSLVSRLTGGGWYYGNALEAWARSWANG